MVGILYEFTGLKIIEHPQSCSYEYGDFVTLSVSAVGAGNLTYEWIKDGKHVIYSPTLTITSFQPQHQGCYICVVSDGQKSVTSSNATLALSK